MPSKIVKRPNGIYYYRYKDDSGRERTESLRTGDKREAKRMVRAIERELEEEDARRDEIASKTGGVLLTVRELAAQYKAFAEGYYRRPDGTITQQGGAACRILDRLSAQFGDKLAADFNVNDLRAFRETLIHLESGRTLSRSTVNSYINIVRQAFKWGAARLLMPADVYVQLSLMENLKAGRSEAAESREVTAVDIAVVEKTKLFLTPLLRDIVDLQLLTGSRSSEILTLRPCDINRENDPWEARPPHHKTAYQGKKRVLYLGPRAQAILKPYLLKRMPEEPLFPPSESADQAFARRAAKRVTPMNQGNRPGTNKKDEPSRKPGEHYTASSYYRAIQRACKAAKVPEWHPHQLRHTAATLIRKQFGLDAAQVILGHSRADVTQVYAEADAARAREIVKGIG